MNSFGKVPVIHRLYQITLPNIVLYMNAESKNTALNIILDKPNIKDGGRVLAFFS